MTRPLILLVEDNPGDAGLWCEAFAEAGVDPKAILLAGDGQAALATLLEQARAGLLPRLIISDARLPGMDGTTLGQQVHAVAGASQVPFVIVSGLAPPADQPGDVRWFQKPSDFGSLCSLAKQLCGGLDAGPPCPPGAAPPSASP